MSAIHSRWELVEPLLFAYSLRAPSAFHSGSMLCSRTEALEELQKKGYFDGATIEEAFSVARNVPSSEESVIRMDMSIRDVSRRWLVTDGDHWSLRVDAARPGHEIIRWRALTILVPSSIVIAGALASTTGGQPTRVQILPSSIAPKSRVAHLHVHLGPMLPFETLWMELWHTFLIRSALDCRRGRGIASIEGEALPEIARYTTGSRVQPGLRWQWMLELAFVSRVWMASETQRRFGIAEFDVDECPCQAAPPEPPPAVLSRFSRGEVDERRRTIELLSLWSQRAAAENMHATWSRASRSLRRQSLARRHRTPVESANQDVDDEVSFIARSIRHSAHDSIYARVLFQYLRIKVALHSRLVVDPWSSGLAHFLDVVKRDRPYCDVVRNPQRTDAKRFSASLSESPLNIDSDALEIHIPPPRWLHCTRQDAIERRWVISFPRASAPSRNDPDGTRIARGWRSQSDSVSRMCRLLARRLDARPSLLIGFRGIGLMDCERNGPVWLFGAALRRLMHDSATVAASHPFLDLKPLRTAIHLGEDFDHMLSGLRQIYEPFEWGIIGRGDRLGHALALGLDVGNWSSKNSWIRMRPWDRVLDIGFIYWAFGSLGADLSASQIEGLRVSAREAFHQFDSLESQDPLDLARDLWLALPKWNSPSYSWPGESHRLKTSDYQRARGRGMILRVLDDVNTGRRAMSRSFMVETRLEVAVIKSIQSIVHDRVSKMHVAIEVNPSSNLLIGGFRSIFEQPAFHTDDLPVTLNADDPLSFATTLADEYAYAWAGMVLGSGVSPHQAARRLEEAARNSRRYAFSELQEESEA